MTIDIRTQAAFKHIDKSRHVWKGGEEVHIAWVGALQSALDVQFDAEQAKLDSSYNNVVIEFKAPGLFNGSDKSAKFIEATQRRLLPYIQKSAKASGLAPQDYRPYSPRDRTLSAYAGRPRRAVPPVLQHEGVRMGRTCSV